MMKESEANNMGYILATLMGYILGCSNLAYYISKAAKKDIRRDGSGNLGASNATVLFGWKAGVSVALHDIGKALLAAILAKWLFPELEYAGAAAGVAAVLGHIFPFYLKFKGGKGFASYLGMIIALDWKFALVILILVGLATIITDYIVAGTTITILASPVYLGITAGLMAAVILAVATAVILYKHRMNYVRIWKGEELGLRGAVRGDNRVK